MYGSVLSVQRLINQLWDQKKNISCSVGVVVTVFSEGNRKGEEMHSFFFFFFWGGGNLTAPRSQYARARFEYSASQRWISRWQSTVKVE